VIPLANVCFDEDEVDAAASVVKSGWIREGERVKEFEEKFASYVGARYAVATSSGTAALHTALLSLGVKTGDEVIVPSLTCIPPVSMTVLAGAVPVFCDIEPQTYNLDVESVKRMITGKTKAIIPINYAGHPAALDILSEIAEQHNIFLLNDAAEALGATYAGRRISAYGEMSIFSFSPNKAITTGEGGMIVTNDGDLAEKARIIKDYGQQPRFHHIMLGHNYHMGELNAALGIAQLKKIDDILTRKRKNAQRLTQKLSKLSQIKPPIELSGCMHTYCLYSVEVKTNALREYLLAKLPEVGVQSRVYFPPMHSSPMLKNIKFRLDRLANTRDAASTLLSLPTSAALTEDQIQYISASVTQILDSFFGL
jgi:perosamine synthetase